MALIDALPKFRHKPLDIEPTPTRLVEKPIERVAPPSAPVLGSPIAPATTLAAAPVMPKSTRLVLPDVYSKLNPLAEAVSDSTITNPKARAALIAQAGLEKGWGWDPTKDYNYGNITSGKSWKGQTVMRPDKDAKGMPITQVFRKYGSSKEYLDDYLNLLKNQYPNAYAELHAGDFDIERFAHGLVGGESKYATDPKYKETIKKIYTDVDAKINKTNQ